VEITLPNGDTFTVIGRLSAWAFDASDFTFG